MPLIIQAPVAFTDTTGPKLYRDSIMNPGSMLLFDVASTYSNPLPTGNLTAGQSLINLVDGAPVASVTGTGPAYVNNGLNGASKHLGISFPGVNGSGEGFTLGSSYDLHATPLAEFMVILWCRVNSVPVAGASGFQNLLSLATNSSNCLFNIDCGTGNTAPRAAVNEQAGTPGAATFTGFALDQVQQIAVANKFVNGARTTYYYLNGVLVTSQSGGPNSLLDVSAVTIGVGGTKSAGKFYSCYMENLTTSGADPLAQAQLDYAQRVGNFAA